MAIISRVETPRALSAAARRSIVGGSLRMVKPPFDSLTLVCVLWTVVVWPELLNALGWLTPWLFVTVIVSEPSAMATC